MIDLHTHSIFSDGELIPSELARRAVAVGYRGLAITDHADVSNMDFVIPRMIKVCRNLAESSPLRVIPGIELTHVSPDLIPGMILEARAMGAKIVIVHGETIVEPVAVGTNLSAIKAHVDILAHPGLISDEEVRLAAKNGVFLEITARRGHSLTNGHVAALARRYKADLVLDTDSHSPQDLISIDFARRVAAGAGLREEEISDMFLNSERLLDKAFQQ